MSEENKAHLILKGLETFSEEDQKNIQDVVAMATNGAYSIEEVQTAPQPATNEVNQNE